VHLLTLNEPSVLTSRVENRFICEGVKPYTSFVSPRRLNTKLLSSYDGALKGFVPFLILLNSEGFSRALMLVNIDGRLIELDGWNLSNVEILVLDGSSSFSLPSISSAKMC